MPLIKTQFSKLIILGIPILCVLAVISVSSMGSEFDHQHADFTELLQDVVVTSSDNKQTRVDYNKLNSVPQKLNGYLAQLSLVTLEQYQSWSEAQKLSFLINAYNGFTLKLIQQNYAEFENGEADSIKDLGSFFSSPWKKAFFKLLGEQRSLDNVEHDMIRVWFERPRIHAALVCAAVSCPPLRNQAFIAQALDSQLDDQMQLFLSDKQNNRFQPSKNVLYLSSIFKWYGEDFEKGQQGFNSLKDLIMAYQHALTDNPQELTELHKQDFDIRYNDYDWRLNDISTF